MVSQWTELNTAADLVAEYSSIIKGKTILATGVTPGSIGAAFVEALAAGSPALIILAGRSVTKLDAEVENIKASLGGDSVKTRNLVVDLLSLESVRAAAAEVNGWADVPKIDVLVNCAGIMASEYALTKEGFESQFAANHLAHFLLTNLIMDKLLASGAPRVVSVSSNGHRLSPIRWADINFDAPEGKTYNKWSAYGQSKTANMLFAVHLARVLGPRGLLAFSVHPGLILDSNLAKHLDFSGKPNDDIHGLKMADQALGNRQGFGTIITSQMTILTGQQGAATNTYASFEPSLKDHNGAYLHSNRVDDPYEDDTKPWATDKIEAHKLWKLSEKMVGQEFNYQ